MAWKLFRLPGSPPNQKYLGKEITFEGTLYEERPHEWMFSDPWVRIVRCGDDPAPASAVTPPPAEAVDTAPEPEAEASVAAEGFKTPPSVELGASPSRPRRRGRK